MFSPQPLLRPIKDSTFLTRLLKPTLKRMPEFSSAVSDAFISLKLLILFCVPKVPRDLGPSIQSWNVYLPSDRGVSNPSHLLSSLEERLLIKSICVELGTVLGIFTHMILFNLHHVISTNTSPFYRSRAWGLQKKANVVLMTSVALLKNNWIFKVCNIMLQYTDTL